MKVLVLAVTAGLLSGCNMVTSHAPLFTEADAARAAPLKPGAWMTDDPRCRDDPHVPADLVADCTGLQVDRAGRLVLENENGWITLVADGQPEIVQLGRAEDGFFYAALRPTKTDAQGRVTALSFWFVECGPPPPDDAKNPDGTRRFLTYALAPGLEPDNGNCIANDADAVRAAALASEERQTPVAYRWIRAGPGAPGPRHRKR